MRSITALLGWLMMFIGAFRFVAGGGVWDLLLIGAGWIFRSYAKRTTVPVHLEVDEQGVRMCYGEKVDRIAWDEVARIDAVTTGDGPWGEDLYLWLRPSDDTHAEASNRGVVVPNELGVPADLVRQCNERFPGFDDAELIKACGCTSDAIFKLWERPPAPHPPAAGGMTTAHTT